LKIKLSVSSITAQPIGIDIPLQANWTFGFIQRSGSSLEKA
jgi:hypothetical protein